MRDTMRLGMHIAQPLPKQRKQKKTKVWKKVVLINLFLIGLIFAIGLLTPAFYVQEITVSGTHFLSADKVIDAAQLKVGRNIFSFRKSHAEDQIASLSFVDKAKVIRNYPDKLSIIISESKPLAQIRCGESLYIVVDSNGKILDTTSEQEKYTVPVIEGITVEQFEVSKIVNTMESASFETLLQLSKELSENNMIDKVQKLSLSQGDLYLTFLNGVTCDIGNGNNSSYKIRFLKEVISQIPENKTGTIEFIDEYKAVFKADE